MRGMTSRQLVTLALALLAVLSLSSSFSNRLRGFAVSTMIPFQKALFCFASPPGEATEKQRLQLENLCLHNEIERIKESLRQEQHLTQQIALYHGLVTEQSKVDHLEKQITPQLSTLPANIVFRSMNAWSNSCWIDIGERDNQQIGRVIVGKNSPVLVGTSIVGVVDYVGKKQSRVRLITDPGLTPSVRAVRGGTRNLFLHEVIGQVETFLDQEDQVVFQELQTLKHRYPLQEKTQYLAKGEVHGESKPLWRQQRPLLSGIGFNLDFSDDYGPARDLRTGEPEDGGKTISILDEGDLLVTTGMDGVFPEGLNVGYVTKVKMLREGDYYYELEARPSITNLHEIKVVFVTAPIESDDRLLTP